MNIVITTKIDDAIVAVEKLTIAHKAGVQVALPIAVLTRVKAELENMRNTLSPQKYTPSYPRFVMDWPDDTGIVKQLINVAYEYKKLKG